MLQRVELAGQLMQLGLDQGDLVFDLVAPSAAGPIQGATVLVEVRQFRPQQGQPVVPRGDVAMRPTRAAWSGRRARSACVALDCSDAPTPGSR